MDSNDLRPAGASATEGYFARRRRRRVAAAVAVTAIAAGLAMALLAYGSRGPGREAAAAGALGAVALGATTWPRGDVARWLRGAAGERATAALLDRLPPEHWSVLHDLPIPGSRANIDHLVIGPTGIWVVDTKTTLAPVTTRWRSVWFGNRRLDPRPTLWEAEVASDRLGLTVRPLVAVHGEGLRRRGGRAGRLRVVPARSLLKRLQRGRHILGPDDVSELERAARVAFGQRGGPRG
jgi:hypothetical protein